MRRFLATLAAPTSLTGSVAAATNYPIERATILDGSPFDFKVEFSGVVKADDVKVTVNGKDYKAAFGKDPVFTEKEEKKEDKPDASAVIIRGVTLKDPGQYTVEATAGSETKKVVWDVYDTAATPKVKNIIFLLGDGLSVAHRTGARIMSKGVTEGKANGRLNMDELDHMAFIGTSSVDSIAVDSANSMSAYMTGHKSSINALGVYADRTPSSLDDPRVETIAEAVRRQTR
jgi:alkaline phosphatase